MSVAPAPPPAEIEVGLGFYATATPGIGGRIKERPEDFLVQEVSLYPRPDPAGPFTVLRVESRDWEQHSLAQSLARELGLPPHALAYAGTKDRRAVAERLFSYRGAPPATPLQLPRVIVHEAYRARDGLVLGHHYGNRFDVVIRGALPTPEALPKIEATRAALDAFGGVPNFFGLQRFGEVRPVTHQVGRLLVRGDAAQGVALYLEMPGPDPKGPGEEARRRYRDTRDARAALRDFPLEFRFERILLDHLARGQSPTRALAGLSRELRMLFIHAYQSLLFNRFLSLRWHEGVRFDQPIIGDTVLRVARDGTVPSTHAVPVEADNLEEVRTLVSRGGGRVAGPLIGYATPEGAGRPGAWIDTILEEEQIRRPMFRLPELPEIASSGAYRPLLVPTPPIQVSTESPGETDARLRLRFALPKGAYATVVLREFMKAGSIVP